MWAADYGTSAGVPGRLVTVEAAEPVEFRQNALFGLLVVVVAAGVLVGVLLWRTRENSAGADRHGAAEPTAASGGSVKTTLGMDG